MKLNSKLCMLAVAMATVGCSDDIDNGPNTGGGQELNGPTTYMNIAVNAGLTTRAGGEDSDNIDPTGGESGDGDEPGSLEESEVKDVTVILFKGVNDASGNPTSNYDINTGTNEIAGVGYVSNDGMVTNGTPDHLWASTVKIQILDTENWEGQQFGVLAVTNLGENNAIYTGITSNTITTVQGLANQIIDEYRTDQGFVMSTHTMQWGNAQSYVTLDANSTAENAPTVEVFVERLAAKIRINDIPVTSSTSDNYRYLGNYVYAIGGDRVVLQNGAVVNQLTSGSYLLKRVTIRPQGNTEATINDKTELLGDELAKANGEGVNFIIDPWTKVKTAPYTDYTSLVSDNGTSLTYDNHLNSVNYASLWGDQITSSTNTAKYSRFALNGNSAATPQMTLCYTMENTTSREAQKNGYSTGILFQAQYFPEKWTTVLTGDDQDETGSVTIDYDDNQDGVQTYDNVGEGVTPKAPTFYVKPSAKYNAIDHTAIVYDSYEAILAGFLNDVLTAPFQDTDLTISDFNSTNIVNVKVSDFNKSKAATVVDPFGYIEYLKGRAATILANADDTQKETVTFASTDSFESFQDNPAFDGSDYLVYTGGVCYYPFWIRHANNNNPTQDGTSSGERMGISEFAIVRNNIYDISVTRIDKLGVAGSEIPDPDKDDETDELFLFVNLHVRNWVLRINEAVLY